ncbi:hypothetical protein ACO0R3_001923 [Hanseniaspora guilliermondii]
MKVNFKDLKKNLYCLDCQPEETIQEIKVRLIDLLKLDASKFELRLIYSGSILKDNNTAEKSGLVDDCTVSYMVKKVVIKKSSALTDGVLNKAPEAEKTTPSEQTPQPTTEAEPVASEPTTTSTAEDDAELAQSKQIIMELGYNEQQATAALKMSNGNADRACELLMSGVLTDEQIQATNEEEAADEENDDEDLFAAAANAVEGNNGGLNADGNQITLTIDDLMNLRQIASGDVSQLSAFLEKMTNRLPQFKEIIQANPEMFLSMLLESLQNDHSAFTTDFMSGEGSGEGSELASNPALVESVKKLSEFMETSNIDMQELYRNMSNPNFDPASVPGFEELSTAIASNPEIKNAMLEIMKNPGMMQEMTRMQEQLQSGSVVRPRDPFAELESGLNAEEKQAVDRLCELGFERILVIQIYLACDKNEEVAANMLFTEYAD